MDTSKIIDLLFYAIPTIVTGLIAYFFFKTHVKNEDNRRLFSLKKEMQKKALPSRLQAYERMTLFLERITPSKLLIRVTPTSSDKDSYESLLIHSIEQEFEHNLSQQIYVTDKCWSIITTSKNTTIQLIRKAALLEKESKNKKKKK